MTNRLLALSSAAVLTVYSAGYLRTRAAAERLQAAERARVVIPERRAPEPRPAALVAETLPSPSPAAGPATSPTAAPESTAVTAQAEAKPAPAGTPEPAKKATTVASPAPATTSAPSPSPSPSPAASASPSPASPSFAGPPAAAPTPAATPDPSPTPSPSPVPQWKDGTFSGWGTSRHGDIEATVVIEAGRIVNAYISQCWTRYSCSWVAHLQGQVVARQSPEVDYVTRATESANAFYYAVVQALSKAK